MAELGPMLPCVARRAISDFASGNGAEPPAPAGPAAPVFVTLRAADGTLRGCVGSMRPAEPNVVHETARSAVLAATRDPRFTPVRFDEISGLVVEVSVLSAEEPVADVRDLDPHHYGIVVRDEAGRQGLLLPGIPGIDDAATQLALARRKAGVPDDVPIAISRFRVDKWSERGG